MGMKAAVKGLSDRLSRPRKPLKECGLVGLRSINKTFKAGGRPIRWKPSNRVKMTGGQTLVKSARLMRSVSMKTLSKSVQWFTNVKYAAIQNLGGIIPARTIVPRRAKALRWIGRDGHVRFAKKVKMPAIRIPAREFMVIQDADQRVFGRIFGEYLATDSRR